MAYMNKLVSVIFTILVIAISPALAAAPASFTGEWADKNYLNGRGVFQLSLEQKGSDVSVFFSAAHNDGSGAAPEADGKGKVTGKGMVEFTWEDSFKNSGTGPSNVPATTSSSHSNRPT